MLWGPMTYGSSPFTRGESEGPSRGELWPKLGNIRHKTVLEIQPRTAQSLADPKSHQNKGQSRYKTKLERKSKNIRGKAAIIVIQCFAPDRAVSFNCYNHSQPLYV